MWFMTSIVEYLASARDNFYAACVEVSTWVWPFWYLATPLYQIYVAFHYLTWYFEQFDGWLDWAVYKIGWILSTWDIWVEFKWWFDAAENAWRWVFNAVFNVWNICNDWWSAAQLMVKAWVDDAKWYAYDLIVVVDAWLSNLQADWDAFKGRIPTIDGVITWWGNWSGNVLSVVNTWWTGALGDVQALIDSAFTVREGFWSGWQDWRDQVVEFFTDPEDWLYKRMDSFFERFW